MEKTWTEKDLTGLAEALRAVFEDVEIVPLPQPRCTGTGKMCALSALACSQTPTSPPTISSGTSYMPHTSALMSISLACMPLMRMEQLCVFIVCASGLASVLEEE